MKRIVIVIPLFIALLLGGAVLAFNAGLFHGYVEREVQAALGPGSQVQLGKIELLYRWPPLIQVANGSIGMPQANVQWRALSVEILKLTRPYSVSVNLTQPQIVINPSPAQVQAPAKPEAPAAGPAGSPARPLPLSLRLVISGGEVKSQFGGVRDLNLRFEQKLLMGGTPASVHADGSLHVKALPVALPFKADTDTLTFNEQTVKTSSLAFVLGGLTSNVQGTSLLAEGRHRWLVEASVKDLSRLPQPPMNIPAKNWRGEVELKAEINKAAANQPWSADGTFSAKAVSADVDYKQDKAEVSGPFRLDAEGKFAYHNERLGLPNLKASIDFSAAKVVYQDMLSKAFGRPMKALIAAGGDQQKLSIQELVFQLGELSGKVTGGVELSPPWPADVHFTLKPANLAGIERLFLPLRASPVQGELSADAKFTGPLGEPLKARILLDSLVLKKFSGVVGFEREGLVKLRGPVLIDIQGAGEWADGQVKTAEGKGALDVSAAALVAGPLRKEEGALLKSRYAVRTQGQTIHIDEMEMTGFVGALSLKGKVENGAAPTVDVNVEAKPLSLSELRIAMPAMREQIPKGNLSGKWRLHGQVEMAKPWYNWPLTVSGSTEVTIPEYKVASAPPPVPGLPPKQPPAPAPVEAPSSFLPDGELTRKAKLSVKAQIDQFHKDSLIARAIRSDGVYSGGKFTGQVTVSHVFGGSVQVKNLIVPMLQVNPKIQGSASWLNLVIEDAIAFAKPEYRGMVSGKTTGLADFATVMPARPEFMTELKVRGDVAAQPVTFNTVKIGDMINEQIAKLPALKLKPAKVEPLRGKATAQFNLNAGVVDVPSFTGTDVNNSEIRMKGKVVLSSMEGDFAGTFFWSDPPVKGCALEGNADGKGRMIVPLAIKGNLMKPGFSLLSDVLGKLAAKTVECEGKKLVEKVKVDGKKALEKEAKKALKSIFGK